MEHVLLEERGGLARVTLNRPEKRNALTRAMLARLAEVFEELTAHGDLRAVILCAAGEAFSAGTDIVELSELDEEGARAASARGQKVCELIERCNVPVIAAVNGIAAGGGCELALACHLRLASAEASFSLPETELGLIPAYGGTQRLTRVANSGRALEMMLTARAISADEALRAGLVNRVVAPDRLLDEADSMAREIAALAPLAIRACLEAVTRGIEMPLAEGLELEAELFARLFNTEDVREGTRAFLEKRPPAFRGK